MTKKVLVTLLMNLAFICVSEEKTVAEHCPLGFAKGCSDKKPPTFTFDVCEPAHLSY